ncbi:hypothetical protein FJT64_003628 [Amphibalanus amphitrite]|uniref:Uncharacterized protein n=1 Tax=Amphibalanus amphitrite TaxID=1232801 RepID=A0A6A4W7Z0_AMPAM|nr:hypothetical protein FJT64_003628 [Amphibalanus amphitrite]
MSNQLVSFTAGPAAPREQVVDAAAGILSAVGNVLTAAQRSAGTNVTSDASGGAESGAAREQRDTLRSITLLVNNITSELTTGVLKAMSPGSEPVTIQVLGMSLTCQRDLPESMDNKTVESAEGGFALSSAEQMLGGNISLTGVVDIKSMSQAANPFSWDESAAYIKTPVLSLAISEESGEEIDVSREGRRYRRETDGD